ncbi:CHAT domain-containing protein [Blastopirellula sp. JC732]|uniref:CHAT domain-containing protein n=1 Tax=Blastopirellula sediminis TaxID=2894196 RepID=A0A9X1MQN9_9BACT|nr:CHAT domain-containing protein [Blastopirellula sediminis]MCC9604987.1 CHAT domain-containing protein [Blastopirellula sediminis]MCC9631713.1 CHAT domain-containing protein [Blastopirellula sediminis]
MAVIRAAILATASVLLMCCLLAGTLLLRSDRSPQTGRETVAGHLPQRPSADHSPTVLGKLGHHLPDFRPPRRALMQDGAPPKPFGAPQGTPPNPFPSTSGQSNVRNFWEGIQGGINGGWKGPVQRPEFTRPNQWNPSQQYYSPAPTAPVNRPEVHIDETGRLVSSGNEQQTFKTLDEQVAKDRRGLLPTDSSSAGAAHERGRLEKQLRFLDSALMLAKFLEGERRYAECLTLREEMLQVATDVYGPDDWRTIDQKLEVAQQKKIVAFNSSQLAALAQLQEAKMKMLELYAKGKYDEAIPYAEKVKESSAQLLGVDDSLYASALHNLGTLHQRIGKYPAAESFYRQTLDVRRQTLGAMHPRYAGSVNNLGGLYYLLGDYAKAEPLYAEALAIRKATLGNDDTDTQSTRNNLGLLYQRRGEYEKALQIVQEAYEVRKASLGDTHADVAASRNNLASLCRVIGDYDQAKLLYRENMDAAKATVGERHPDYAQSVHNLAVLYESTGEYLLAEPLYRQALEIWTQAYGEIHPDVAQCQSNLAAIDRKLGNFPQAEALLHAALRSQKVLLGEEHPDYANTLNELGYLYWKMERYAEAKEPLQRAAAILLASLGEQHPEYAACLDSLASVARDTGDYATAEKLFNQATAITAARLGKEHPTYGECLTNLGVLYRRMGRFDRAEALLLESLGIREKSLGGEHPDVAETVFELARLYHLKNDLPKATARYQEAYDLTAHHVDVTSTILTEPQQLALNRLMAERLYGLLTIVLMQPEQFSRGYEAVLRWKGAAMVRQRAIRRIADEPDSAQLFAELQQTTRLWTALAHAESMEPGNEDRQRRLQTLANRRQELELGLSERSAAFRAFPGSHTAAEIQRAIPPETVLIDYFEYLHSAADPVDKGKLVTSRRLIGFLLQREGAPLMIDLGSIAPVEQAVEQWRQSFGASSEGVAAGKLLRNVLLEPFAPQLAATKTLLISPDGVIGRIPFAALPGKEKGTYLLEDYRLATSPAPRLLAEKSVSTNHQPSKDLLLMGGIDYNHRQAAQEEAVKPSTGRFRGSEEQLRNLTKDCWWSYLPNTHGEVAYIKTLYVDELKVPENLVAFYTEERATEEMFRNSAGDCFVLHLATHGYFVLPDSARRGAADRDAPNQRFERRAEYGAGLLSGIVFAGANKPPELSADDGDALADDGYLTADEISTLPLFGVKLVVLSACDTGLGEIAGGEGILGIQRAFQISGVDATIASYWKIDDLVTRRLMEEFYKNYLREEMSPVDALREAQLWVLRNPNQLRGATIVREPGAEEADERTPPRYWAAFSMSGIAE